LGSSQVKITADANVLLRALVLDDQRQSPIAAETLRTATEIAIALQTLCELAWVLKRGYRHKPQQVAAAIRRLIAPDNTTVDRMATEAGLSILEVGGDFADGVIAFEGRRLGGTRFATFDRDAARLLELKGYESLLLDPSN
jgi:predicted nucleic-acid-binding protein